MKRLRQGRWWQLALALGLLLALGVFYVHLTRLLPPVPRLTIHPSYSPSVILFSPDSKFLVTGGKRPLPSESTEETRRKDEFAAGHLLEIWDVDTGVRRCSMNEPGSYLELELSPDGQLLLAKHSSSHLTLWNTTTGEQVARLRPETDTHGLSTTSRFSPDGQFVLMPPPDNDDCSGKVVFWEVATRTERTRIDGRLDGFDDWTFSTDGKRFTSCRYSEKGKRILQRWEIHADNQISLSLERQVEADSVAVSPDLTTFVTVNHYEWSGSSEIQFWDLPTGIEKTKPFQLPAVKYVSYPKFSPSGRFLTALVDPPREGKWIVWDTSAGLEEVGAFSHGPGFSPRERWILVTDLDGSEAWDSGGRGKHLVAHHLNDKGTMIECSGGACRSTANAQFSADDRWLITSGTSAKHAGNPAEAILSRRWNSINEIHSDSVCRLWDVDRGEEIGTFRGCWSAQFSPDGRTLIMEGQNCLRLYPVPPSHPLGIPLALTVATWGLLLLVCWFVKSRLRRWERFRADLRVSQYSQTGANSCHS